MFQSTCTHCGAPVKLASSASVFAVCGYCNSVLAREGASLRRIGEVSEVLEDYSPLQIGSSGTFQAKPFTVVGRLQMDYVGGRWNEWFVTHDDGTHSWLADASGQFTFMREVPLSTPIPSFASLAPGSEVDINGTRFEVSDKRTCAPHSAQGELPIALTEKWEARVVDLRHGERLVTLDYSGGTPVLYSGHLVQLSQMGMQLLRDEQTITDSAGRLPGTLDSLSCPTCAHSLTTVPSGTSFGVCPSCNSSLDLTSKTAQLIEKGNRANADMAGTTLPLGASGSLKGHRFTVIGSLKREAFIDGEPTAWTEYLLYHPKAGFLWLSESDSGEWLESEAVVGWPAVGAGDVVQFDGAAFEFDCAYQAEVAFAAGSFNWRVARGDTVDCAEYLCSSGKHRGSLLVRETNKDERTWSVCRPVSADTIRKAFSLETPQPPTPARRGSSRNAKDALAAPLLTALIVHLMLWVFNPSLLGFFLGLGSAGILVCMAALMENNR